MRRPDRHGQPGSLRVDGAAGNELAAWAYDNSNDNGLPPDAPVDPIGQRHHLSTPTPAVCYTYTTQELGFNKFGKSIGEQYIIPSTVTGAGSWAPRCDSATHYTEHQRGLLYSDIYYSMSGLPAETVIHGYEGLFDLPDELGSGST